MVELVDTRDLKSLGRKRPCRFNPGFRHLTKTKKSAQVWAFFFLRRAVLIPLFARVLIAAIAAR